MPNEDTRVTWANTSAEIAMMQRNIPGITLMAGGTQSLRNQPSRVPIFSPYILAIRSVAELKNVAKTERYMEFGAAVTLSEILTLGKKNIPEIFHEALFLAANPGVRAIATLGGNLCVRGQPLSAFAPLLALDARLEYKGSQETSWVSLTRLHGDNFLDNGGFIAKIRVPTEKWDISRYRRLGRPGHISSETASFVFLVRSQKNVLADIRVAITATGAFRNREFENLLIGRTLPISEREIRYLMERAEAFIEPDIFDSTFRRLQILNLLEAGLKELT